MSLLWHYLEASTVFHLFDIYFDILTDSQTLSYRPSKVFFDGTYFSLGSHKVAEDSKILCVHPSSSMKIVRTRPWRPMFLLVFSSWLILFRCQHLQRWAGICHSFKYPRTRASGQQAAPISQLGKGKRGNLWPEDLWSLNPQPKPPMKLRKSSLVWRWRSESPCHMSFAKLFAYFFDTSAANQVLRCSFCRCPKFPWQA